MRCTGRGGRTGKIIIYADDDDDGANDFGPDEVTVSRGRANSRRRRKGL